MKINQLKKEAEAKLSGQQNLEVELWLVEILGKNKEWLFVNGNDEFPAGKEERFWSGIEDLRQGRPLAQLTGIKEFYGLEFRVNSDVLIPRPETELVVDLAKDFIEQNLKTVKTPKVLDVGTGSGCIILALASVSPNIHGVGVEISKEAFKIARENSALLLLDKRVEFKEGDLLENIEGEYEIVLANLPYIGRERFNFVAQNVTDYEPEVALYGGPDGLDLYRKMFEQLRSLNWRPKLMIGEFGFGQDAEMQRILEQNFASSEANLGKKIDYMIISDLAGIPRVFVVNFI